MLFPVKCKLDVLALRSETDKAFWFLSFRRNSFLPISANYLLPFEFRAYPVVRPFHLKMNLFSSHCFQFYFVFLGTILRIVYFKGKNNMLSVLDIWKLVFSSVLQVIKGCFSKKSFVALVILLNLFAVSWACRILGAISKQARFRWRREIPAIVNTVVWDHNGNIPLRP